MRRAVSKIIPSSKFLSSSNSNNPSSTFNNTNNNNNSNNSNNNNNKNSINNSIENSFASISSNLKIDFNSVDEFYIQLDQPHKTWLPGDEVPGQIILISKKNLVNIVITLSLIGYVKLNLSHSKLRPIKHTLFDHTIKIFGGNNSNNNSPSDNSQTDINNGLSKGEHVFPFIVKLPNKRIFTSIDFGKGSITYVLRASIGNSSNYIFQSNLSPSLPTNSLTSIHSNSSNPNTPPDTTSTTSSNNLISKTKNLKILHNPSYSSEKIINIVNPIDVTSLPSPKPKRLILKDPRSSATKKLSRTQSSTSTINTFSTISSNNSDSNGDATTINNTNNNSSMINNNGSNNTNNSNGPSMTSTTTTTTTNNNNTTLTSSAMTINSTGNTLNSSFQKPVTIKVSLEVPQRGYLRGELIPIKLSISHLKKIQDLNGIIITFVRVCRLDNGPDTFYESFRKDLQQSIIPLYVDPVTFQSEINTSVRVPADSFPSIVGCPLVSFQYFIEVLINLSGKSLSLDSEGISTDRHSPNNDNSNGNNVNDHQILNSNGMNGSIIPNPNTILGNSDSSSKFNFNFHNSATLSSQHHNERSGFINTDKFKRSKKFLQLTTEIIIGTHRSLSQDVIDNNNNNINNIPHNELQLPNSISRRSSSSMSNNSPPGMFNHPGSSPSPNLNQSSNLYPQSIQLHSSTYPPPPPPPLASPIRTTVSNSTLGSGGLTSVATTTNSPTNQGVQPSNSQGAVASANSTYINPIPETMAMNTFQSPPYFENDVNFGSTFASIPDYNELQSQPPPNEFDQQQLSSELSEKARMRAHEESLLPSAPPMDDETLPTQSQSQSQPHQDNIEQIPQSSNSHPTNDQLPPVIQDSQFQFFSYEGGQMPPGLSTSDESLLNNHRTIGGVQGLRSQLSNDEVDDNGSVDLYHDPGAELGLSNNNNHENNNIDHGDQYSTIDYVPNYESVNNDRLLVENTNNNQVSTGTNNETQDVIN
ncbi:Rim8 protein [Scheffersomyces coipomensis]|uniref:Rim8 protein n=1 Tax=Scheffersomyces coipomensis TaxID=1788519 RepID=UPI00315C6120